MNEENVYACVGHPSKNDMLSIINWLMNDDFTTIYNRESDIVTFIHFKLLLIYIYF